MSNQISRIHSARTDAPYVDHSITLDFAHNPVSLNRGDMINLRMTDGTDDGFIVRASTETGASVSYTKAYATLHFELVRTGRKTFRLQTEPHHVEILAEIRRVS